jgi:hypothetical protein
VFYLSPYSPQINPDEYLNRDVKTELRSSDRAASKKKALLPKASSFLEYLVKTPERVMACWGLFTTNEWNAICKPIRIIC